MKYADNYKHVAVFESTVVSFVILSDNLELLLIGFCSFSKDVCQKHGPQDNACGMGVDMKRKQLGR